MSDGSSEARLLVDRQRLCRLYSIFHSATGLFLDATFILCIARSYHYLFRAPSKAACISNRDTRYDRMKLIFSALRSTVQNRPWVRSVSSVDRIGLYGRREDLGVARMLRRRLFRIRDGDKEEISTSPAVYVGHEKG